VLTRAHRLVNPLDFKRVVRRGTRFTGDFLIGYFQRDDRGTPRAGFIVAKTVGGAAVRNLVKRRLRAATAVLIEHVSGDLVVRALPSSAVATYADLEAELATFIDRANARLPKP
jgi:ribonuclease P protein component